MNENFDTNFESSIGTNSIEIFEPNVDFVPLDDMAVVELPLSEQELSELMGEVEALELQPFEELEPIQEVPIDYGMVFDGLDYYDFDGKDVNQNTEQLNSLLDGFTEDNWSNFELNDQKEQIAGLYDYVNDVLGLENPPNIEYYNEQEEGNYGGYNSATNTLSINEYMLHDSKEAADTVAHELWHAYQHERAANPQSPKDFQYQHGFDNYIRPSDDFDMYQTQLVEAEARAFADQIKNALAQIRRA
ncbi:MAG: hypothetical protein FWG79_09210 [Bacteroidales bacterium]|nr:hypothetical protein [Bacteroidales bacterium]